MIETSSLNWATKDFSKEVSEIKYLSAVVNDINSHFNILKNSVEVENKQLDIFYKSLISNSKSFMNEISSINFNQVDSSNLINVSMNFGNFFDLIGKIFCDENKTFNENISKHFLEFSHNLSIINKFTNGIMNFPFKEYSYLKNKKIQISEKCQKSFKELELCLINSKNENYSKEKTNEKAFYIVSDFEDKMEVYKNLNEQSIKAENALEEILKSLFYNVIKISYQYLKLSKKFFEEITYYKKSFSEKVLNTVIVNIESFSSGGNNNLDGLHDYEIKFFEEKYNQDEGDEKEFIKKVLLNNLEENIENYLENSRNDRKNSCDRKNSKNSNESRKDSENFDGDRKISNNSSTLIHTSVIEIKNLPEISESLSNFLNTIPQITSLKKKILSTFCKFVSDIFKQYDTLIHNLTKIQKTTYNFKSIQYSNTSYSYLINTSLISQYEFIRSLFDFFFMKQEEILSQKNNFSFTSSSIDSVIKEISNEENNFVHIMSKLNKEYTNYRNNLTKFVSAKEKIITQIVYNKETLTKLEEASQSLSKKEIALENLKSEELKINEQIYELNSNYKKFIEDLIENFKKSYVQYKAKDKIRFKEYFRDAMMNFMNLMEKTYSNMNEYLQFKNEFHNNIDENKIVKDDLNAIFKLFMKEYLMCDGEEMLEMILYKILKSRDNTHLKEIEANNNFDNNNCQSTNKIISSAIESNASKDELIIGEKINFISSCIKFHSSKIDELILTNLMKEEDINSLREKINEYKMKNKSIRKSFSIKNKEIANLLSLYNLNKNDKDEKLFETFFVSYLTQYDYILPGMLFVTDKRIVFQSFIYSISTNTNGMMLINYKKTGDSKYSNNNSQNMRNNSIEIMKHELISIKEINKTNLKIITESDEVELFFDYFSNTYGMQPYPINNENVLKFLNSVKELYKIADLSKIQDSLSAEASEIEINRKIYDFSGDSSNLIESQNANTNMLLNLNNYNTNDLFMKYLSEINFFNQIKDFHKSQYDHLSQKNIIRQQFRECFVRDKPLLIDTSPDSYIPLHLIYKYIYDNHTTVNHCEYNKSKNFILNLKEIRKDYNISFNYINDSTYPTDKIPKYYSDPIDFTLELLTVNTNTSQNYLKNFLSTLKENFGNCIEYEYKYTHPMKKTFMGPSKLEMHDKYKIIFVSPLCLIVEITTFISGFMMMDSFYTVAQYKYDADMFYDSRLRRISWKTKVNAKFAIEFVKECWFRNKIESNGLIENEEYMRDFVLVHVMKVLKEITKEYHERQKSFELNRDKLAGNSNEISNSDHSIDSAIFNKKVIERSDKENNSSMIVDNDYKEKVNRIIQNEDEAKNNINKIYNLHNISETSRNILYDLILISLIFIILLIISFLFSMILPGYYNSKELLLIILLSINLVFILKMNQMLQNLQQRLNRLETTYN